MARAVNQAGATQAEFLFSTLNVDGSTIAPISSYGQDSDGNLLNNEINSGFRLMNLNVSGTRYLLLQKLNIVLPILCGVAVLSLAAVIVCLYQGKLFTSTGVCSNDERINPTGILGNSNCSTSSASTNNTAIGINAANLDSSNCLINELTCGLLADQQSLMCPSGVHSQYQPSSNYSECMVHSLNCGEHEYKLCSEINTAGNMNGNLNNMSNMNSNLNALNSNLNNLNNLNLNHEEFATVNKANLRSSINTGLFRSALGRDGGNVNNPSMFPSPYAFSRLNEYRTPTIDAMNRQDLRTLKTKENSMPSNLSASINHLTEQVDSSTTTFKLKPISNQSNNDQQHNYDTPMFFKQVN